DRMRHGRRFARLCAPAHTEKPPLTGTRPPQKAIDRMTTTSTRPAARGPAAPGRATIPAKTLRTDRWWFEPAYTVVGLSAWLIWGLIHTLLIKNFYFAQGAGYHYLTPFFSP